jgi:hypothetical protein
MVDKKPHLFAMTVWQLHPQNIGSLPMTIIYGRTTFPIVSIKL